MTHAPAYSKTRDTIESILGVGQSINGLERMNKAMASGAESFHLSQFIPDLAEKGEILAVAADGKGIVMRDMLGKSECGSEEGKKGKKKVACVGAAYTIDPFCRTGIRAAYSATRVG